MKSILIGEVYAKALRRRLTSVDEKSQDDADETENKSSPSKKTEPKEKRVSGSKDLGSIINIMAVDTFKVSEICAYLHYFVNSLVMAVVAISLLYSLLGWPAIVGSLSIIFMVPLWN